MMGRHWLMCEYMMKESAVGETDGCEDHAFMTIVSSVSWLNEPFRDFTTSTFLRFASSPHTNNITFLAVLHLSFTTPITLTFLKIVVLVQCSATSQITIIAT